MGSHPKTFDISEQRVHQILPGNGDGLSRRDSEALAQSQSPFLKVQGARTALQIEQRLSRHPTPCPLELRSYPPKTRVSPCRAMPIAGWKPEQEPLPRNLQHWPISSQSGDGDCCAARISERRDSPVPQTAKHIGQFCATNPAISTECCCNKLQFR